MTKIEIPFNAWSKDKLRKGIKTSTFRYHQYGTAGDTFETEGKEYELLKFEEHNGRDVIMNHYKSEGAASPKELRKVLNGIHWRTGLNPERRGTLHYFAERTAKKKEAAAKVRKHE